MKPKTKYLNLAHYVDGYKALLSDMQLDDVGEKLHTGQAIATREETTNGEATARHLEKVLATYPDVPILLLWDRTKWHGGPAVRALLQAHPRLEVMRFPTAAPDLNPQ